MEDQRRKEDMKRMEEERKIEAEHVRKVQEEARRQLAEAEAIQVHYTARPLLISPGIPSI